MLFHDFHEAYLGDISSQIRRMVTGFDEICNKFQTEIERQLEISCQYSKAIDKKILLAEMDYLFYERRSPSVREYLQMPCSAVEMLIIQKYRKYQIFRKSST